MCAATLTTRWELWVDGNGICICVCMLRAWLACLRVCVCVCVPRMFVHYVRNVHSESSKGLTKLYIYFATAGVFSADARHE